MPPLIIFEENSLDGDAAAFAARLKFGDKAEYLPVNRNSDVTGVRFEGREIFILDFCFTHAMMKYIFATAKRVVWLAHQKSAFDIWCGGADSILVKDGRYEEAGYAPDYNDKIVILDNNKSGALLSWEFFHPDSEVPMSIRHIDDLLKSKGVFPSKIRP